jgi:hypothetical protein
MLTHNRLLELLHYEPLTGVFTWRVARSNKKAGDVAGYVNDGYRVIGIDGGSYAAGRLAVFYVTGEWPSGEVDHKNHATDDNRQKNLRDVTTRVNQQNQIAAHRNSGSGILGVSLCDNKGKPHRVDIRHRGRQHYIGRYAHAWEADHIYRAVKRLLHPGSTLSPSSPGSASTGSP